MEVVKKKLFNYTGEGPYWDYRNGELNLADISTDRNNSHSILMKWNPLTDNMKSYKTNEVTTFGIPCSDPQYSVVSMSKSICLLDWNNSDNAKLLSEVHQNDENVRFNDAKCDSQGILFAGTMSEESGPGVLLQMEMGNLYRYRYGDKNASIVHNKVNLSNGIDWTSDESVMLFTDSYSREILVFDYDSHTSNVVKQRSNIKFDEIHGLDASYLPDGITMDVNDKLWIACFFGNCVIQIDIETCQILQKISVEGQEAPGTTSCCWGGDKLTDLYVTSAAMGGNNGSLSGSLFCISGNTHGTRGRKMNFFNLQ